MTAVASPPQDTLVSQPRREVSYAARRENLYLVKTARYPVRDQSGAKVDETRGIAVQFVDGQFRLPTEGKVRTKYGVEVDAAEIIQWLDRHPLNGDQYEGFFPVAQAVPLVSAEERQRINDAMLSHQTDELQRILDAERAGWNRPALVAEIEGIIVKINDLVAQYEEAIRAQVAEEQEQKAAPKRAAK